MQQTITGHRSQGVDEEIQNQAALQVAQIQAASMVAQHGVYELERTHQEVSALYQKTLATALQAIQQAASSGRLTPLQLAELYHRTEAYRYEMLSIVEETGHRLIHQFDLY